MLPGLIWTQHAPFGCVRFHCTFLLHASGMTQLKCEFAFFFFFSKCSPTSISDKKFGSVSIRARVRSFSTNIDLTIQVKLSFLILSTIIEFFFFFFEPTLPFTHDLVLVYIFSHHCRRWWQPSTPSSYRLFIIRLNDHHNNWVTLQ